MMEEWRTIAGWEGYYEVSDLGRVRSLDRWIETRSGPRRYKGRVLKHQIFEDRHTVMLSQRSVQTRFSVHQLVALAFIPKPDPSFIVDHRKGDTHDNAAGALRWVPQSDNNRNRHKAKGVAGLVGVCWRPRNKLQKWEAYATTREGKQKFLGRFDTATQAHGAWLSYSATQYADYVAA